MAKCKKRTGKKIRHAIKKQLQYVKRDLSYIDLYMEQDDIGFTEKQLKRIMVIRELYEQQKYMYDNKVHSVKDRIVSIRQPYIRPIVRGKAKSPVEFGAKLDMSIDEAGTARLEYLCFDEYNECDVLTGAIERYRERTGHYPERVLVDQIYRNRGNRAYCKKHGIRISGPALGRPRVLSAEEKKQSKTKLDITTRSSIALSILAMNVNYLAAVYFCGYLISIFSRYEWQKNLSKKLTFSICA